jgi:rhodanese-related sulfurtransferase
VSLKRFALIVLVSGALAAYSIWLRSRHDTGLSAGAREPVPMVGGILLYRLADVQGLYREPSTRVLDVRPAPAYDSGHIPGALSIPENDFGAVFPSLKSKLEPARTIIVYCDSRRCARALRVAIRLRMEGLAQAQVYPAGWNEWIEGHMPTEP